MPLNNEYKRFFIILQEDDKGFELAAGKIPTGYVKIEIKNGKGKLTAYAQNVKHGEKVEYHLQLIAPAKKSAVDMGRLIVDGSGRGELNIDFDADNVLKTGMNISDFMVAAVATNTATPLSGYTGRDKVQWKGTYHVVNKSEDRIDKKTQKVEEVVTPIQTKPVEVNIPEVVEIPVQPIQMPEVVEMPAPMPIKKEKFEIVEIPEEPVEMPVEIPEDVVVPEVVEPEEVVIPEVVVAPEPPKVIVHKKVPVMEAQTEIKAKFVIETEEQEHKHYEYKHHEECEKDCPEIDYKNFYYDDDSECDSDSDSDSDDKDKHKHHEHHEDCGCDHKKHHHDDDCESDSDDRDKHKHKEKHYDYCDKECDYKKYHEHYDNDHHDHDSDDVKGQEYDKHPYYDSPMYRRVMKVLGRLRKYEPFENEESREDWFKIEDDIYLLNSATIPFMGAMMPLGYPFMMNDCVIMIGKKDYIIGVKYEKVNRDKKYVKHVMFGIPGTYNKQEERYYNMRGFTKFKPHKSKGYGFWIMTVDVRTGEIVSK